MILGLLHATHVLMIDFGSVSSTGASRFFSFLNLDRMAATGWVGKALVLLVDACIFLFGWRELFAAKRRKSKIGVK